MITGTTGSSAAHRLAATCLGGSGWLCWPLALCGSLSADLFGWGTPIERERRIRIRLCVAAYAYEIAGAPLIDDAAFDALAMQSNVTIQTGRHDAWWSQCFKPYTGSWIHSHPELTRVAQLYMRIVRQMENCT